VCHLSRGQEIEQANLLYDIVAFMYANAAMLGGGFLLFYIQ
jgi:hypothetical protein